ncbi:MAG: type II toxin-antitoxin system death-on-curing family toxin [Planctomycetota bacterium]
MPSEVRFLSLEEVLAIHARPLEEFGGPPGGRDLGSLERALFRPRTGDYDDLAEMATALFESSSMNHAFVDGNKRIAFVAADIFLRLNGWRLDVEAEAAHSFLVSLLERRECDFERLLPWIRGASVELE